MANLSTTRGACELYVIHANQNPVPIPGLAYPNTIFSYLWVCYSPMILYEGICPDTWACLPCSLSLPPYEPYVYFLCLATPLVPVQQPPPQSHAAPCCQSETTLLHPNPSKVWSWPGFKPMVQSSGAQISQVYYAAEASPCCHPWLWLPDSSSKCWLLPTLLPRH